MSEHLCSVGIDVGTTTTQIIVSRLTVENRAAGFAVPHLQITHRQILYTSPVHFTPLTGSDLVDGPWIRKLVEQAYEQAGITPQTVDTGAVIITGETSRKENARRVLESLSGFAGEFVVATAGPDLESVLAAHGAGAVTYSQETGKQVLHMDIGGGTTNLALIKEGNIQSTGCLNVGGRLLKVDPSGRVTYLSPVIRDFTQLRQGDFAKPESVEQLADLLVQALEMAAGLREKNPLWEKLVTREAAQTLPAQPGAVLSFSGGVADCIDTRHMPYAFGDIGPVLGARIRNSRLCRGEYRLGAHTIRATVIGAGCHSTQLSGSTVFCKGIRLPLQNLPVAELDQTQQYDPQIIKNKLRRYDTDQVVLSIPGEEKPDYTHICRLAQSIAEAIKPGPVFVCVRQDMAKALGNCLALAGCENCLCVDGIILREGNYLDVGKPVGPAFPVVIKTLVLQQSKDK